MEQTGIFKGRVEVRYNYGRFGWTRGGGKTWHGGIDIVGLDDATIYMPFYMGKKIAGTVVNARIVLNKSNRTWEWGWYVCVKLDKNQTPDTVNYLYFCHCASLLVKQGQKVSSGDALAVMGNSGNAADANPPYKHCHLETRATATGTGVDPTKYAGVPNTVGVYGSAAQSTEPAGNVTGAGVGATIIDVSKHQGDIDWAKVPYMAMVRIGYSGYGSGALCKDEKFDANLAGAKGNGKLLGFYFFSQAVTEEEAREEAEFCAKLAPSGYPLFFDSEWGHTTKTGAHDGRADSLSKEQRTACAKAFCERAAELGFTPGVYTFASFATTNIDYAGLCATWPGWLADTRENYDKVLPRYIHQYAQSAKGGVAGIAKETDLNKIIKELPKMDKPATPTKQIISLDPVTLPNAAAMEFYMLAKKYGLDNDRYYHAKYAD